MARTCTICSHPARHAIDKALVAGESSRSIAARYGTVGRMALDRHKASHLPASLVKAQDVEDVGQALDVVQQLRDINDAATAILIAARAADDGELALKAIDRIHRQIELVDRMHAAQKATEQEQLLRSIEARLEALGGLSAPLRIVEHG